MHTPTLPIIISDSFIHYVMTVVYVFAAVLQSSYYLSSCRVAYLAARHCKAFTAFVRSYYVMVAASLRKMCREAVLTDTDLGLINE